ncbi:hypothetical protein B7P43_G13368 [Cryptotermes secundus]|uniref:Uncharacterized protein n=1 Tax=Cryptotermes secundus TaxID=105785 RepID=A0A2J7RBM5_9NEOP|nr:hypothetical protein B7P43_G13368 [Cryptotermes secundus]
MDRATLLFLIFACLTLATHGNNVTDCHAVKCAWMEEKICPGEFFQKEPSIGKCCPFCLVIVEGGHSCISTHPGFHIVCRNPYNCHDGVCSKLL